MVKNIVWYTLKYAFAATLTMYVLQWCGRLVSAKNDVQNLVGVTLYIGLFISVVLLLRTDVIKMYKHLKNK